MKTVCLEYEIPLLPCRNSITDWNTK